MENMNDEEFIKNCDLVANFIKVVEIFRVKHSICFIEYVT